MLQYQFAQRKNVDYFKDNVTIDTSDFKQSITNKQYIPGCVYTGHKWGVPTNSYTIQQRWDDSLRQTGTESTEMEQDSIQRYAELWQAKVDKSPYFLILIILVLILINIY